MFPVMIRVYENRVVKVSMMRPEKQPSSSPSSASAARVLALSAVVASVTAWVPPSRMFQHPAGCLSLWNSGCSGSVLSLCKRRLGHGLHAHLPGLPAPPPCGNANAPSRVARHEKRATAAGLALAWGLYEAIYTLTR